ncbi:MAG: response regulator transcription factor [Bacillota bacterium]
MQKILIIEDEKKIARFLELELVHEGYAVDIQYDGRAGLNKFKESAPALVILDVMLPGLNGMEVLLRIRQLSEVPVIMLTAKDQVTDKVMGLDIGADDYITKPFAIEELLARIRTALRKRVNKDKTDTILTIENVLMDTSRHRVTREGSQIDLTKKEYDLLEYLVRNKGLVLTRGQILENVWGFDYEGDTNAVDVYIRYLRSKIDDKYDQKLIHTVRGVGYTIKETKDEEV